MAGESILIDRGGLRELIILSNFRNTCVNMRVWWCLCSEINFKKCAFFHYVPRWLIHGRFVWWRAPRRSDASLRSELLLAARCSKCNQCRGGRRVWSTYKVFYRTLKLADFFQCLVVSLDFVDVHGQVLEEADSICCLKLYLQYLSHSGYISLCSSGTAV